MTTSATRPPWLCREHELEAFIEEHNPSLNLSALRRSRNDCQLVGVLLAQIVSEKNIRPPCDWEMNLARIHLAVDLQNILKRWCMIGLQKTLDGSALGILFASEDGVGEQEVVMVVEASPKVEVAASPQTVFSPATPHRFLPDAGAGWRPYSKHRVMAVQPLKRPLEDVSHYDGSAKMARLEDGDHYEESAKVSRTEFRCPYYTQDPLTHPECSDKTFPNPRKLKEHVWRFIKPFKCKTCGEGFGREKTRAIHSQHRKTKCKPAPSTYENSPDHRRDQRIEAAKSTQEMIRIFQDYELEKVSSRSHDMDSVPADSPTECSSSESDSSDSLDDGSDGGLDSAAREYMPGACPIPTHDSTHYQQQKPDDHSRPRRQVSLTPDTYRRCQGQFEHSLAPEPFHCGKSAPPNFSTVPSTSEFAQPLLPTIIVTEPEPQQIAMLNPNSMLEWDSQFLADAVPYQEEESEAVLTWRGGSRDTQGHTGLFRSDGWGSFSGFNYHMTI